MVKIKAKNNLIKSIKLSVPYDGTVEINELGEVDVSQSCAEALVNGTHDWSFSDDNEDLNGDDINALLSKIKNTPLEELISIAQEAGYDESEWGKLAKNTKAAQKLMSGYLIKKFNEISEDANNIKNDKTEANSTDSNEIGGEKANEEENKSTEDKK